MVPDLSDRQLEVLMHAAQGLTAGETALKMHVSITTVRSHRSHAMAKLEAKNVIQAVHEAYLKGIFRGGIRDCPSCGYRTKYVNS